MLDRCQQPLGEDGDLVTGGLAALDELDETRARRGNEFDVGASRGNGAFVCARSDRTDRADHTDASRRTGFHERPRTRLDDVEGCCGRCVAGDHDRLHVVLLHQAPRQLPGEIAYLSLRSRPIGIPASVADVDEVFRGQQVDHGAGDGEPTESTVEHPDRSGHLATHIDGPGYVDTDVLRSTTTC